MSKQSELRDNITNKIVEALEKGGLPIWRQTWNSSSKNMGLPMNLSGRLYRGINVLLLSYFAYEHGYESRYFGTFNAIRNLGGYVQKRPENVKAGHWGCGIVFYNSFVKTEEDKMTGLEVEKRISYLTGHTVFNIEQAVGERLDKFRVQKNTVPQNPNFIDYAPAENLIEKHNPEIHFGNSRAFYRPSTDSIHLPNKFDFENEKEYYSTLLHEMMHWTEKRCNWNENYEFSELRAEIGAAFLMAELQVPQSEDLTNHYAYLDSWLNYMKRDSSFILKASAAASKAVDFLMGRTCQDSETVNDETLVTC